MARVSSTHGNDGTPPTDTMPATPNRRRGIILRFMSKSEIQQPPQTPREPDPLFLEIIEGPGLGTVLRVDAPQLVGRSSQCDLVIDHPAVAQKQLRLEVRYGRLTAVNCGEENQDPPLKNGAPFQVTGLEEGDILALGPVLLRLGEHPLGHDPDASAPGPLARLGGWRLVAAGAGLVVLIVAGMVFFGRGRPTPGTDGLDAWSKERSNADTLQMRKVSALLLQARRMDREGQEEEAKSHLAALLDIDPQNLEARSLLTDILAREEARARREQEHQAHSRQVRDRVQPHVIEAERLLAAQDLRGASNALAKALAIDPYLPEATSILTGIEARERQQRREARTSSQDLGDGRARLAALQAEAQSAVIQNAPYRAFSAYQQLAILETDPERAALARKKAIELESKLNKLTSEDLQLAHQMESQQQYVKEYEALSRVLEIYPESRPALTRTATLLPLLEQEARRLYEEGLFKDRQGHRDQAVALWRQAVAAMPVADNEYRRQAEAKLAQAGDKP